MKQKLVNRFKIGVLALCCWGMVAGVALAQGRGGGFGGGGFGGGGFGGGGFGGGGGRVGGAGGSASGSTYATGAQPGTANITADEETRQVFAMTDQQTAKYISQVISNLSRPVPQVLIKVVFVEASYSKGLDFGLEGGFSQNSNPHYAALATNIIPGLGGSNLITQYLIGSKATSIVGSNLFGGLAGLNGVPGNNGGIYSILGADYQATLHAIATGFCWNLLERHSSVDGHDASYGADTESDASWQALSRSS